MTIGVVEYAGSRLANRTHPRAFSPIVFASLVLSGVSMIANAAPPGQVSNPSHDGGGTLSGLAIEDVTLSWSAAPGATSYHVYVATHFPFDPATDFRGEQAGTSYHLGELQPNTFYHWQVNAKNADGVTGGPGWGFKAGFKGPVVSMIVLSPFKQILTSRDDYNSLRAGLSFGFTHGFDYDFTNQVFHPVRSKAFLGQFGASGFLGIANITDNGDFWASEIIRDSGSGSPAKVSALWKYDPDNGNTVLAGDVNGDQLTDLVELSSNGELRIGFASSVSGQFPRQINLPHPESATQTCDFRFSRAEKSWVELADLDDDGKADLFQLHNGELRVMHSNGTQFDADVSYGTPGFLYSPSEKSGVHLGDYDGDGLTDFCQVNETNVQVALNLGGSLGSPTVWGVLGFHDDPARDDNPADNHGPGWWTFAADINRDLKDDLVQLNDGGVLWVAHSTGAGFGAPGIVGAFGVNHRPEGPGQVFFKNIPIQ